MNTIYALADPRNGAIRYIGATSKAPSHRLNCHLCESRGKRRSRRLSWIRHLTAAGLVPALVILESVADGEAELRERFWIAHYRSLGADLTNGNDGGHLECQDPEVRKRIASGKIGKKRPPHPQEMRDKIRATLKGRVTCPMTPEIRAKIAVTLTGRKLGPHSEEHRRKIGTANQGKIIRPETRAKIKEARSHQVFTEAHRRAMSAAAKGKPKSEAHRLAVGRAHKGTRHVYKNPHFAAVLTPDQVREARRLRHDEYWTGPMIASRLGVKVSVIYDLLAGKTYVHVS